MAKKTNSKDKKSKANDYLEQEKTYQDVVDTLKEHGKCALVRPTGFGKTWILTELIKHYNNVLYLYPAAVIRDTVVNRYYDSMFDSTEMEYIDEEGQTVDPDTVDMFIEAKRIEKCTLMTYAKLIRLSNDEIKDMKYDLILMDEVHRVGAPKTKIAVEKLFAMNKKAHFVGATATPIRMDNFDVISEFFCDNMAYTYTLFDSIESGLIKRPNYCYCAYDHATDLKNAALTAGEDPNDPIVKEVLDAKLIEMSKIFNMPKIIKDVCDKYAVDKDYFKFIVFFSDKAHMDKKLDEIVKWFKTAYPKYTISTLRISSKTKEEQMNTNKLDTLVRKEKHIDIIACIDMLNMGYHVNNQTGIIMYRGTSSSTIFIQQLGRALSAGADNSAIVFDIVDNLHRKAVYDLKSSLTDKKIRKSAKTQTKRVTQYFVSDDADCDILMLDTDGKPFKTQYHLDGDNNIIDNHGNLSTLVYDCETGKIYDNGTLAGKDINQLTSECLHATGHEATYREIIAKALAEPMSHRCKYALELHFRTWCFNHNIDYPISDENLKKLYHLDKFEFYNEFCKIIKAKKLDYPLHDAESLLQIGQDGDTDVPLSICAKARNVSIAQILDMLGVA